MMYPSIGNGQTVPEDPVVAEIAHYQELLAKDPYSRAFGQLVEAFCRQGRFADAIAVCDRGLRHHPGFVGVRMTLGHALVERGDLPRAEGEFRRVLELMPDSVPAHRALGDVLCAQGRAAEALAMYRALLDLTPLDRDVRGLVEDLAAWATPGEAAAPGLPASAAAVGEAPREGGILEAEQTVPTYDLTDLAAEAPGVQAETPGRPVATETLADLYAQQGFLDEARETYEGVIRTDPSRADIRAKLAALKAAHPPAGLPEDIGPAAGVSASARALGLPGDDDVVRALEAWRAAARAPRAERGPR